MSSHLNTPTHSLADQELSRPLGPVVRELCSTKLSVVFAFIAEKGAQPSAVNPLFSFRGFFFFGYESIVVLQSPRFRKTLELQLVSFLQFAPLLISPFPTRPSLVSPNRYRTPKSAVHTE